MLRCPVHDCTYDEGTPCPLNGKATASVPDGDCTKHTAPKKAEEEEKK